MRAGRSHLQHRRRPCRPGLRRRLLCGRPVRRRWVEPISPSVNKYGVAIAASQRLTAQQPPGSPPRGPASFPSPGQYPPGQRGPGSPAPWSPAGSPPSPYGPWGWWTGRLPARFRRVRAGSGRVAPQAHSDHCGVVVLVGAAVAVGMWWFFIRGDQPGSTASPFFTPAGSSAASPTPTASPSATSASPSPSPSATNTGTPSPSPAQKLPSSKEIEERWVVVPMRISGSDRPLYLVDSEGKLNQVQLQTPEGGNSNPIMQPSRDTIIHFNAGVLGNGRRRLE